MGLLVAFLVASVMAAGCSNRTAAAATGPSAVAELRPVVAFGDSLTSGYGLARDQAYPAVLERMLRAANLPVRVVNHGVSGDTTARALRRLEAALAEEPSILIVALGANDGLRGVPVSEVRANLDAIIETAQRRGAQVLLCGMDALPLYGWDYTVAFHRLFPALAEKHRVPLVPFLLEGVVANPEMLQPDFIHPNAAGAARIAQTIWAYLQPLAGQIANPKSQIPSSKSQVPNPKSQIPSPKSQVPNPKSQVPSPTSQVTSGDKSQADYRVLTSDW